MGFAINYSNEIDLTNEVFVPNFLQQKLKKFKETINDPKYGFFHLENVNQDIVQSQEMYDRFKGKKNFVHIGIGGSALGPKMLVSALGGNSDRNFIFLDNIDPDFIFDSIKDLDPSDCLFFVVSKSGGTAETNAIFALIQNWLLDKGIKSNNFSDYFVFATGAKGDLKDLANKNSISCLTIPENIGGRFSVLCPVGLFPALFADIDVVKLVEGTRMIASDLTESDVSKNDLLKMCSYLYMLNQSSGITSTVIMPYSSKLKEFAAWFVQLWAESLGKAKSLSGETINAGITPIPAYGATDQHSQVQLFMEGPKDKCIIFIEVDKFSHDFSLENSFEMSALKKLSPYNLSQLMRAELKGTLLALSEQQRPYVNIKITQNDATNLGALILFFESLTVLMGEYLQVNPFDQPGVEAGKRYAFQSI